MSKEQWVNLPREGKFKKDEITEIRRLDFVRFNVKFKKAILSGYQIEIKCAGGAAFEFYEDNERARNLNFKVRGAPGVLTNAGKTENKYSFDCYLNAAADNEYEISAKHKGKAVTGKFKVKSRRKLFYQVMKMKGCPTTSMADMETEFWNPGRKHYIKMKKLGAESKVKFIDCLDGNNHDLFIKESAKGYTAKSHKPYAFGMTFVNYIATPEIRTITRSVNFSLPSILSEWSPKNLVWTVDLGRYLWFELDPKDDKNKRWWRQIDLWFEPDDKPGTKENVTIKKSMVVPTGSKGGSFGGRQKLKITFPQKHMTRNLITSRKGKWKVRMKVVCVRGFSGGFAYTGINLLAIATKSWWKTKNLGGASKTVIHEVGHKVGMVAHGDKAAYGSTPAAIATSLARKNTLPNSHGNLYGDVRGTNDQDHRGPHCSKGAAWDATKARGQRWSGNPGCVMFGSNAIGANKAPKEFCSDCSKIVRKLDLSGATLKLGGFKVSMDEYN
ncbi:MAG: hypothetical protein HKP21_06065 [Xanthomonadales bacterium]|nr:hypothetical protein [Gammaproteobacteria bacterium]NNK04098.1 hypothetical protein [Xanthomonadales bacterium]NNK98430.1 hypothetical protein [Xanthomonadales bacterium]